MNYINLVVAAQFLLLLAIAIVLFKLYKDARVLKENNKSLSNEVSILVKHRAVLRSSVKFLKDSNISLKEDNASLIKKLDMTQKQLDSIKKFIEDMKNS